MFVNVKYFETVLMKSTKVQTLVEGRYKRNTLQGSEDTRHHLPETSTT